MIGIAYASNNNIVFDAMGASPGVDDALLSADSKNGGVNGSSKKPSLLRNQLLRRTTTRSRKRSPMKAKGTTTTDNQTIDKTRTRNSVPVCTTSVSNSKPISESIGAKEIRDDESKIDVIDINADDDHNPKILTSNQGNGSNVTNDIVHDDASVDGHSPLSLYPLHHNEEFEIQNGKNDDLDLSLIESDDEESKTEAELTGEKALPQVHTKSATVATTNLSIVLKGNDILVEYHSDQRKGKDSSLKGAIQESSGGDAAKIMSTPPADSIISNLFSPLGFKPNDDAHAPVANTTSSSQNQRSPLPLPKGIIKRGRDSNLTYHHPRRPLPPPNPPPGYKGASSPLSWTSGDSSVCSIELQRQYSTAPPPDQSNVKKKRVSFDEASLLEQYNWSKLRREARYEDRRKIYGMLHMAMPVIMPYLIAISILVASSMVPLPKSQRPHKHQILQSLPSETELVNEGEMLSRYFETTTRSSTPVIFDIGSRMWDERKNSKAVTIYRSTTDNEDRSLNTPGILEAAADSIIRYEHRITTMESNLAAVAFVSEASDDFMSLEVEGMETAQNYPVVLAHRFELRNPVRWAVETIIEILRSALFPYYR
mmetsp:Transcript_20159/g.47332  ORF Transcript_20159/g.47332 Transcript_20159/m.47332 type:complete len:596 (+) Transcript_20159:174-1961(+)|eukprot:CAMPEP_0197190668 /NCGR_PEP_ID=MMETSP1423-20130617/22093_1 /TAXON_ID=476441 /ORGANISM="Pseudo-nitzschia heimii, Strain UNC1101" /LENGTH=595 /DNA_ID=CAMNT_0042643107 /DNA_START=153 /DNA_END=1940 /DNA_ORIENTATION=-